MENTNFSLENAHIAIIGLGLMGGSLALALHERCRKISAIETQETVRNYARRKGMVHEIGSDPGVILQDVDLVILACPVFAIIEWITKLPEYIQGTCIVMDVGSTKEKITEAYKKMPANFDPIGSHPICGKETLSLQNAEKSLYREAPFVFTPLARTSERARSAVLGISKILGANPYWLDAETHDRILALTSHLPYLLSSALTQTIPDEAIPFIGPGLRSSVRLAGTPSSMMSGVLTSNRNNILSAIENLQSQISELETCIREHDDNKLNSILESTHNRYQFLT